MKQLLLTLFVCISVITNATTYYISNTGNDNTGNGTIGNPWKSLFKATSTVNTSGDIIHVTAGTYTETQTSNLAVGVSIDGDGMTTSIIKSSISGQWSAFLMLESQTNGTNGNQSISNITFDGQYVSETNYKTWMGIWVIARNNVEIHHTKIINFYNSAVIFDGNTVTDPTTEPFYATGNSFHDCIALNSARIFGSSGSGILSIGGQNGMQIYNNTITQNQRPNFKNGWPIKLWDNGWLKGCRINNNVLTKAPYVGTYPGENGDWDFCIELFNIRGLEIDNNDIQGSIDLNYNYKGTYAYSAWIHHNNITHLVQNTKAEGGIILEFRTESILIENNIINNKSLGIIYTTRGVGNDGGYPAPGGQPAGGYSYLVDNVIRNNLFSNMYVGTGVASRFGIGVISEGTDDPQISNMQIYNNTIVAKPSDPCWVGLDFSSQSNGNANGMYIRNNIVSGFSGPWIQGTSGTGNTNINGMTLTHNDAFGNGNGNTPSWPGGNPTSYTYNNNMSVNPLFISTTDFHLQTPSSPAIDAGINVGLPYNGSAPDMGCYETGGIATGIQKQENDIVTVYPNPTKDIITINCNNISATSIELFDITGKLMMTEKTTNKTVTISLNDLTNGIYILKINSDNNIITKKIIKE